jgi:aryl-alcohol dehydrogenase-like predicted oxidoreductase
MRTRHSIGARGLEVAPICLGANVFGWTADPETSFAVLDAYVAAGGNFIDTANNYSAWVPGNEGGESETIIGRWMSERRNRDDVVIATKVGMQGGPTQPKGLTREKIRRGVEASLARLQTDRIDIYYAHEDDAETPLAETMGAFDELVNEGIVGVVGASNYTAARLRDALTASDERGYVRYELLQPHYNLMDRSGYEAELAALCGAEGIAVAPYFALARGFLTGKYRKDQPPPATPRAVGIARDYLNDRGWRVIDTLESVATAHGCRMGEAAIAWLRAKPEVVSPIASATNVQQVAELAAAAGVVLTPAEVALLDSASAD